MNHRRTSGIGCTGPLILFVVILLGLYVTTHPTFLSSMYRMATSNGPLTLVRSTPTEDPYAVKFYDLPDTSATATHAVPTPTHVIPTATPTTPHKVPNVQPVNPTQTPVTVPESTPLGNTVLLMGGLILCVVLFAVAWYKIMFVPLRRNRRKEPRK